MIAAEKTGLDPSVVLTKALISAGRELGLTQTEIGKVIGKGQSAISRSNVDADSKSGELAKIFIRIYRALYVMVGGNQEQMQHWMHAPNRHTKGVPAEQVKSITGLMTVSTYLDAIRGKV